MSLSSGVLRHCLRIGDSIDTPFLGPHFLFSKSVSLMLSKDTADLSEISNFSIIRLNNAKKSLTRAVGRSDVQGSHIFRPDSLDSCRVAPACS